MAGSRPGSAVRPLAQGGEDRGRQAGDLHLGHPEFGADLSLGLLVEEGHQQDPPGPRRQLSEQGPERLAVHDLLHVGVLGAEHVAQDASGAVAGIDRGIQGGDAVQA
jgi:hypothetical protein